METMKYILFLLFLLVSSKCDDELIAVSMLMRHGMKIPLSFYATDPYKNATWPFVLGDLTNEGVKEMYGVGQWLRKKYTPFLSRVYQPNEIYAFAVAFDRCLMSAESALAGLYPPSKDEVWNPHVRWQPVPVHSSAIHQDIVANMMKPCGDKVSAIESVMQNSTEYSKILEKYLPLFSYLSQHSRQPVTFSPSFYSLYDTLYSEKQMGLKLPEWAERVFPELLKVIDVYAHMSTMDPDERRIQVGPLLTRIVEQFERAISGENFGNTDTIFRKFMAYCSTEWSLYDFAYGLGFENIHVPDYGALFLIELRKRKNEHYVNILFRNSSAPGTEAQPWHFEGQKFDLNFETFKRYAESFKMNTTSWVSLCDRFVNQETLVRTGVPMS